MRKFVLIFIQARYLAIKYEKNPQNIIKLLTQCAHIGQRCLATSAPEHDVVFHLRQVTPRSNFADCPIFHLLLGGVSFLPNA